MDYNFLLYPIPFILAGIFAWLQVGPYLEKKKYKKFKYEFKDASLREKYLMRLEIIKSIGNDFMSINNNPDKDVILNLLDKIRTEIESIQQFFIEMHKFELREINNVIHYSESIKELMCRPERINSEEALINTIPTFQNFGNFCIEKMKIIDDKITQTNER